MVADWLYAVEVANLDGRPLPPATLERRLLAVVQDAQSRLAAGEHAVPVSVLTTDERDQWAKVRFCAVCVK